MVAKKQKKADGLIKLTDETKVFIVGDKMKAHGIAEKPIHPGIFVDHLSKSDRRRLRRGLDKLGRHDLAIATFATAEQGYQHPGNNPTVPKLKIADTTVGAMEKWKSEITTSP